MSAEGENRREMRRNGWGDIEGSDHEGDDPPSLIPYSIWPAIWPAGVPGWPTSTNGWGGADMLRPGSGSSSVSSDMSSGEDFVAEYRWLDQGLNTARSRRRPMNVYSIHTYLQEEPRGTIVDKVFSFSFDRKILPGRYDNFFRFMYPPSPNRDRVSISFQSSTTKVGILKGHYQDESGVVVKSYYRGLFHKVVVHDGTVVVLHQRDLKILDPGRVLPNGYPVLNHHSLI